MGTNHVAVAIVVALSCPILVAACAGSTTMSDPPPEADLPASEIRDDPDAVPQGLAQEVCISAARTLQARREFCNSAFVEPNQKQACWSRLLLTRAEWIGWCYWTF
jgi:hypothetical protein